MKRVILFLLVFSPGLTAATQPDWKAFDRYVNQAVADWKVPGLAIAVVHDQEVVFAKGYGVQRLGLPDKVDVHTRFAIGSTTKAMTAAGLALLVEESRVKWDDAAASHVPQLRFQDPRLDQEVTVRDLLTHRTGLGNADFLWYGRDEGTSTILQRLRFLKPQTSMRSHFTYQNIMYAAAGEVIAAVSGQPWEAFMKTRLFAPLSMGETLPLISQTLDLTNVASPHHRVEGEISVIENASVDAIPAAGSIWSSVLDLSKWIRFLLAQGSLPDGRELLPAKAVDELFTPQMIIRKKDFYPTARLTQPRWTTYGLGWFQADYQGRKTDFHTGSIDGMVAIVGLIRDEKVGVCVLANLDHAEVRHALMYRVFDLFSDAPARDWSQRFSELYAGLREEAEAKEQEQAAARVQGTSPSLELESYAGNYSDSLFGTMKVELREGKLRLTYGPGLSGPLEHWHYDTFRVNWEKRWRGHAPVTFYLDHQGKLSEASLGSLRFQREPEQQ